MQPIIVCLSCLHLHLDGQKECDAFPDGIPDDILTGGIDHLKPFPGQKNRIIFEKINEK